MVRALEEDSEAMMMIANVGRAAGNGLGLNILGLPWWLRW